MDQEEERHTIAEGSSVEAFGGAVIVGCSTVYPGRANVRISSKDGTSAEASLEIGGVLRLSDSNFTLILTGVDPSEEVSSVLVVRRVRVHAEREPKPNQSVETIETTTSCRRELEGMVAAACSPTVVRQEWDSHWLSVRTKSGWFRRATVLHIGIEPSLASSRYLFMHGTWDPLEVTVLAESFLQAAENLAAKYFQKTGCAVKVLKEF